MRLLGRANVFLVFFGLCFVSISAFASPVQAEADGPVRVYGRVFGASADLPLPNASIVFWSGSRMFITETDASGFYAMNVTGKESYQVYAYHTSSPVPVFDYIPASEEVYVGAEAYNLSFTLSPGAVINLKGELRFFKTLQPPKEVLLTIVYKSGLRENATSYTEDSFMGQLLNLRNRLLFVPPNVPIKVEAGIYYPGKVEYHLSIDQKGDFLILKQGDLIDVDLGQRILLMEVNAGYEYAASTQSSVGKAEEVGFYVSYERNELLKAKDLLDAAVSATGKEAYEEAYANLREAYLIIKHVEESLPSLYVNASVSTLFITPFLCFTATTLATLASEKRLQRLIITFALYGLLLSLLYLLYPGYAVLGMSRTVTLALASFFIVYFVVYGLPYAFKERTSREGVSLISAVIMAFSMSTKNLRRRKLRTSLTLILILVSVFAFTALTSFSVENRFAVQRLGKAGSSDGFFIRKATSGIISFNSLQQETYRWLQERSEITLAAPKMENVPQEPPWGLIRAPSSGLTFQVWGVLGVVPSLEAKITPIESIVARGRFLKDEDLNGILISEEAAKFLKAEINDTLQMFNQRFTLTGIFTTRNLDVINDFDGNPFVPYMIIVREPELVELTPCPGLFIVIVNQKKAQELPRTIMSRIVVQTRDAAENMPLARQAVLKWTGTEAFVYLEGETYRLFIGSYYLASGFIPALIPLILAALNIRVWMGNVIYERKQELMIMSSLGLNPFHITALFLAEALTISVAAGSLGYLLGISSYHFMSFLPYSPLVKHKVEAVWGIIALFSAISAAVVGSVLPALKSAITVTPSLVRKWKIDEKPRGLGQPWILSMPIRIKRENLDDFFKFLGNRLRTFRGYGLSWSETVGNIYVVQEGLNPVPKKLFFTYFDYDNGIYTENEVTSKESLIPNWYVFTLASTIRRGPMNKQELYVRKAASLIRRLILLYTIKGEA